MSISLDSITISANSANVAINSPSIDLTSLQVSGFELFVEGVGLPLTIVSGGNNSLVIADGDRPASTLTARKAKIIRTKAPLQQATDAMEGARQELVSLKNSASETASNNSLARRDSNGRLKGQTAVSDNDLVPLKQLNVGAFSSIKAEEYGLKQAVTLGLNDDLNALLASGLYYNPTALNTPSNNYPLASAGSLHVIYRTPNNVTQTFTSFAPNQLASEVRKFVRTRGFDGWSPWVEVFHSGNTNFNDFGGNANNDVIAIGFAASSSLAIFYLPLSGKTPPNSVSVTGTFAIRSPSASTKIATGLTPTFASSASSNKVGFLQISTAGLTGGQPLELQTEGADTKIVVNY